MLPGGADTPALSLWDDDAVAEARQRWHEVQLAFVDDPHGATDRARELVSSTVDSFAASITQQRDALDQWRSDASDDTEQLRMAMQRYRELLDRLLDV